MRTFALALLLATAIAPVAQTKPSPIAMAVAAKDRPAEAIAMDAGRKPAEVLAFEQLKPGMNVLDVLTGQGYYAEIMGRVVGKSGSVVAFEPASFAEGKVKEAVDAVVARNPNIRFTTDLATELGKSNSYDFVMIHLNYHDFYWESEKYKVPRTDPNRIVAGLFQAVKPGGTVAVIDHVGPAGDTRAIVDKMHRIDPEVVKADFKRGGFVLDGESNLLRMPGDDHTKSVFDPDVRGKTDRFTLRFRKPK